MAIDNEDDAGDDMADFNRESGGTVRGALTFGKNEATAKGWGDHPEVAVRIAELYLRVNGDIT